MSHGVVWKSSSEAWNEGQENGFGWTTGWDDEWWSLSMTGQQEICMVHRALLPRHVQGQDGFIGLCSWGEHEMSSYPILVFYSRSNWVLEWGSDLPTSRSGQHSSLAGQRTGQNYIFPKNKTLLSSQKRNFLRMEQELLQATSAETETLLAPQGYILRPITLLPSSETQVTFDTSLFWETMLSHPWVFLMILAPVLFDHVDSLSDSTLTITHGERH